MVPALFSRGLALARLGITPPAAVLMTELVPAGTHRGEAVLPGLLYLRERGLLHDAVGDPGYSLSTFNRFFAHLRRADIPFTFKPARHQLTKWYLDKAANDGVDPKDVIEWVEHFMMLDGYPMAAETPEEYWGLTLPGFGAKKEVVDASKKEHDDRAKHFGARCITSLARDGATRWVHPINVDGGLRSEHIGDSLRRPATGRMIDMPADAPRGSVVFGVDELPLLQPHPPGTTPWYPAYYPRRILTETTNSRAHGCCGALTDLGRGFSKLLDFEMIDLFQVFTFVALNKEIDYQWRRDRDMLDPVEPGYEEPEPPKRKPRSDRAKRFDDLQLEPPPAEAPALRRPGDEPPP